MVRRQTKHIIVLNKKAEYGMFSPNVKWRMAEQTKTEMISVRNKKAVQIPPYLVKSFFLENQGFFQYIINKYLRRRSHRDGHFSVSGTKIVDLGYTK